MIRRCEFDRALLLVRRSGVHTEIEARLRPSRVGGRPRQLAVDVFLAALILTVMTKKNLALTLVHEVLTKDLAVSYRIQLGVLTDSQPITVRQVRYLLEAIETKLAYTDDRVADLSAYDRAERRLALQNIFDRLLAACRPSHLPYSGAYAVDDSGIDSAARGKRRNWPDSPDSANNAKRRRARKASAKAARSNQAPAAGTDSEEAVPGPASDEDIDNLVKEAGRPYDPFARWGYRTRTYDNRSKMVYGYKLISFIPLAHLGSTEDRPFLVERVRVVPADTNPVDEAFAVIESLLDDGIPVTEVIDDRLFSYSEAGNWACRLRGCGIEQVIDLHPNDRGVRDFDGIKMIDGWPHCPLTPDELVNIVRPANLSVPPLPKNATAWERIENALRVQELETFRSRIAERFSWAFRRVQGPDETGKERYECPAQAGKRRCDRCPMSRHFPDSVPEIEDVPEDDNPPTCCQQRTVTIPGDVTPKIRQRLYWGSDEWIASYSRRSRVEGGFGNLKSPKTEDVRRGFTFVVGAVKAALMLVIAQVAANLRCLRQWAQRTGDRTDPLTWEDPEDHGFEELGPDDPGPPEP